MFAELKKLVAELSALKARADKYRNKSGRIQISLLEYNRLAQLAGRSPADEPGEMTFFEYVAIVDEVIEAACSGRTEIISEEM